jgi:hypothetical protein
MQEAPSFEARLSVAGKAATQLDRARLLKT